MKPRSGKPLVVLDSGWLVGWIIPAHFPLKFWSMIDKIWVMVFEECCLMARDLFVGFVKLMKIYSLTISNQQLNKVVDTKCVCNTQCSVTYRHVGDVAHSFQLHPELRGGERNIWGGQRSKPHWPGDGRALPCVACLPR